MDIETMRNTVSCYYKNVYRYCYARLGNAADADDITQDVFLLFLQKYESLENNNLSGWLYATASIKIKEHFRKSQVEQKHLTDINDIPEEDLGYAFLDEGYLISAEEIESKKEKLLTYLKPKEQQLLEMIYNEHLTYKVIGEQIQSNEQAVGMKAYRLRKKIFELAHTLLLLISNL